MIFKLRFKYLKETSHRNNQDQGGYNPSKKTKYTKAASLICLWIRKKTCPPRVEWRQRGRCWGWRCRQVLESPLTYVGPGKYYNWRSLAPIRSSFLFVLLHKRRYSYVSITLFHIFKTWHTSGLGVNTVLAQFSLKDKPEMNLCRCEQWLWVFWARDSRVTV